MSGGTLQTLIPLIRKSLLILLDTHCDCVCVDWYVSRTKCVRLNGGIFLIIVDLLRICCNSVRD